MLHEGTSVSNPSLSSIYGLTNYFLSSVSCGAIITRVTQASWGKRDEVLQVLPVASIVSVTFSLDPCVVFNQCYPCWTQVHVTTYPSIIYDVQVLASKLVPV